MTAAAATDAASPAGSNPMFARPNVLVPFGLLRPTLDVLAVVAASELTGLCPSVDQNPNVLFVHIIILLILETTEEPVESE